MRHPVHHPARPGYALATNFSADSVPIQWMRLAAKNRLAMSQAIAVMASSSLHTTSHQEAASRCHRLLQLPSCDAQARLSSTASMPCIAMRQSFLAKDLRFSIKARAITAQPGLAYKRRTRRHTREKRAQNNNDWCSGGKLRYQMTPPRPRLCAVCLSKAPRLGDGGRLCWRPCESRNTSCRNSRSRPLPISTNRAA